MKSMPTGKYRSGLERRIARQLESGGVDFDYESLVLHYQRPPSRYRPDFILPNGIIIEAKGRWTGADRRKIKLVKEQHPEIDLRMIFSNSRTRLNKRSRTTYGEWCEKHGIPYADETVPEEWLNE
jgi:hypothetical protein